MNITIDRKYKKQDYCIGKLYINDEYFCDTVEDQDRGLTQNMTIAQIKAKKVYAETAIPTGSYKITLDIVSNRFGAKDFYQKNANKGKLPRLIGVPGYDGVLIHCGNTAKDSAGCIIVGKNKIKGGVTESKDTFIALYKKLMAANTKKEIITLTIK